MKIVNDGVATLADLKAFLDQWKRGFSVETVAMAEAPSWKLRDGALHHQSGGFFSVVGVELGLRDPERCLMLYQPQSAVTGLLSTVRDGERHFLLQARAEPGVPGGAQYGATVQSTPANYLRLHGGGATPYIEFFTGTRAGAAIYGETQQLDLGERYFMKTKRMSLVECSPCVEPDGNYVWVSASIVRQALLEPSFMNIDLRSFFAVMPWQEADGVAPGSTEVRQSALATPRAEVLGRASARLGTPRARGRFVDLRQLPNWQLTERGLFEREPRQGFSVEFYKVTAPGREVTSWVQPLVNSANPGRAALCCRRGKCGFEVLVRIGSERGLATSTALLPTFLRYPGTPGGGSEIVPRGATTIARTLEGDEGGRFYNDTSVYELLLVDDEEPMLDTDDTIWMTIGELKQFLARSNLCSIQLRGLVSLLLGVS